MLLKNISKPFLKIFLLCHTAIITLFVIVIWVRLSQKHVTQNKLSNGDVKVRQYLNTVIEIMGQSVINVIFNAKKRVL